MSKKFIAFPCDVECRVEWCSCSNDGISYRLSLESLQHYKWSQIITFLSQLDYTVTANQTFCLALRGNIAISEKQNNNDTGAELAGMSSKTTNDTKL